MKPYGEQRTPGWWGCGPRLKQWRRGDGLEKAEFAPADRRKQRRRARDENHRRCWEET